MYRQVKVLMVSGFILMGCLAAAVNLQAQDKTKETAQNAPKAAAVSESSAEALIPKAAPPKDIGQDVDAAVKENSALAKDIYRLLGLTYNSMGQFERAIAIYEKLNKFSGDDIQALYRIAEIQKNLGKEKDAEATYERLVKATPQIIENYYPLIEIYQTSHQLDKLKALLKQAEAANSGNQMILARIAEIRAKAEGSSRGPASPSASASKPVAPRKEAVATPSLPVKAGSPRGEAAGEAPASLPNKPSLLSSEPASLSNKPTSLSSEQTPLPSEPALSQGAQPSTAVPPEATTPPVPEKKRKKK